MSYIPEIGLSVSPVRSGRTVRLFQVLSPYGFKETAAGTLTGSHWGVSSPGPSKSPDALHRKSHHFWQVSPLI